MTAVEEEFNQLGDTPPEAFRKQLHELADWIADYRETIAQRRVSPNIKPGTIVAALPNEPPEHAEAFDQIFADVNELIIPNLLHWGHPQFAAYFGATSTAPGMLAEMISAAVNVNAMTWRTSPAATELEIVVLDWLRQWLKLPAEFRGVVYDTASISTMHALAAAREEAANSVRAHGLAGRKELPMFRVYTSDQAHSSVEKAAIALGLGERNVVRIESDADFRLKIDNLKHTIAEDIRNGFKPLAVVATVGTTSTASVDPVPEIAAVCREHQMWLHVDAAYGGGLALLPECEWVTSGWSEADSLVINPHKMLFVPFDFSVLYLKNIERLRRVFALVPEYLRGDAEGAEINYMDYGVQLGRRFRAVKAWMVWRTFGRAGMAARIREHLRLAKLLARWIDEAEGFELFAPVVMGVVCFRCVGSSGDIDKLNSAIVERINASGRAYVNQTKLRGRTVIRIGLGNILTTEEHIRNVWSLIRACSDELVQ